MSAKTAEQLLQEASAWWTTEIIDIHPGKIGIRGYPIQDLIGTIRFPEMIWLMLRGELPSQAQAALLEAALVASVDHGPQAPSIAISRMAVTCGLPLNGAMASAINALDDVHGGAGQQCMEICQRIAAMTESGTGLAEAVDAALDAYVAEHGKIIPGFGHRFHPTDPRTPKLLQLVEEACNSGAVGGHYARIGRSVEEALARRTGKRIPMNIDGATAVIFSELGFAAELGRGLFILSRAVGILAHAWEQKTQGGRIKGPMPPAVPYTYTGEAERKLKPGGPGTA
ncbi:citryl-CoA lyase [Noviherbaspirillum sp. ST9]|uniref:citryl-CoA lyase n=1 Tax=Noviherbaspirillum sp. ST9 TaxID=3401606 RepID=UPI003B585EA2